MSTAFPAFEQHYFVLFLFFVFFSTVNKVLEYIRFILAGGSLKAFEGVHANRKEEASGQNIT